MTKLPEDVTESDGESNDTFFTYSESRPAALSFVICPLYESLMQGLHRFSRIFQYWNWQPKTA